MGSSSSVLSREGLLAFLVALGLAMALWPGVFFAKKSMWSTDAVLTVEPWRSELGRAAGHPHNAELGDWDFYVFPQLAYVQRQLHEHGELPLWDAGIYAGVPLEGNVQVGLLDPFHLALGWFQTRGEAFSPWRLALGLTWFGVLRFVLCAVFSYLWLRRLLGAVRLPLWWAAALGAVLVAAGPYASLWRLHTPEQVFSLVPLALYFAEGLLASAALLPVVGLGVALGVSNLGGYPQTSLFFAAFLLVYVIARAARRRRAVARLALAGLLSAVIALPAWLPYLSYVAQGEFRNLRGNLGALPAGVDWAQAAWPSVIGLALLLVALGLRSGGGRAKAAIGILIGGACVVGRFGGGDGILATWLFPWLLGHPVHGDGVVSGARFIETVQSHVGLLVALVLAAGPGRLVRWGGVVLVLVLLVGGRFPPLYALPRLALPLLEPTRIAALVPLLVGPLFALSVAGLTHMSAAQRSRRLRDGAAFVLAFVGVLVVDGLLRGTLSVSAGYLWPEGVALVFAGLAAVGLRSRLAAAMLAVAAVVFAVLPGVGFQPALDASETYPPTETVRFLAEASRADPDLRVFACDPGVLPMNSMLTYGIRQSLGVDGVLPVHYGEHLFYLDYPAATPRPEWSVGKLSMVGTPLFDVLAARLVVARRGDRLPAHFRVVHSGPSLVVAENTHAAPRVYLTGRSFVRGEHAAELLARPVTEHVGLDAGTPPLVGSVMTHGTATIRERGLEALTVATTTDGAAWLVVLDGNLRGWHASVDGATVPIEAAFGAFRCVQVPAGKHEVRFVYHPRVFWWSVWASGGLLLLGALLLARYFFGSSVAPPETSTRTASTVLRA